MVLVTALSLLALFSIVCIVLSVEDPNHSSDPRDVNPILWAFGRR
jgi:hypothetical protein